MLNSNNPDAQIDPDTLEKFINGELKEMIEFIAYSAGIHPVICMAIISVVTKHKALLLDSVGEMCKMFDVDERIGRSVAEISLDKFNPDTAGKGKISGTIQIASKNMLGQNFNDFPLEVIDDQFDVQASRKSETFYAYLQEQKHPMSPFYIIGSPLDDDSDLLQRSVETMQQESMEKIYHKLWEGLNRIQKGTLKDGITEFS